LLQQSVDFDCVAHGTQTNRVRKLLEGILETLMN